jgi:tetratricopeptide (TPR) repeat protein
MPDRPRPILPLLDSLLASRRRASIVRVGRAAIVACLLVASTASAAPKRFAAPAGEPSTASIEEARARYSVGNRAVEAGRWADALIEFERAYALSGVPSALFNVATTLRALGRHVEARDAFDQLLSSHPTQDPADRKRALALRQEEQSRIATLQLDNLEAGHGVSVSIDGHPATDDGARPLVLEIDPGRHALRIERPRYRIFTWKGDLADGDKRAVRVELEVEPLALVVPPTKPPPAPGGVLRSPVFWTIVGVVVVGAGAAGTWWGVSGRDQRLDPGSPNVVHL